MASSIPPLMCNTPPPMDGACFEDDDDDNNDDELDESIHDDVQQQLPDVPASPAHYVAPLADVTQPAAVEPLPANEAVSAPDAAAVAEIVAPTTNASVRESSPPPPLPLDDDVVRIEDLSDDDDSTDDADFTYTKEPHSVESAKPPPPQPATATASSPTFVYHRSCDSPPSLHFHDPPALSSPDADEHSDAVDDAVDVPEIPNDTNTESISLEEGEEEDEADVSSMASLQLSPVETPLRCYEDVAEEVAGTSFSATAAETAAAPTVHDLHVDSFDEFAAYEEHQTSASPVDVNSNTLKTTDEPTIESVAREDTNDFGADFSQFSAFQAESEPQTMPWSSGTEPPAVHADVDDDADDDFGDFADATTTIPFDDSVQNVQPDADDDDDFGDFSDFQQTSVPSSTQPQTHTVQPTSTTITVDVQDICARLGPLLTLMFPPTLHDSGEDSTADTIANGPADDPITRTVLNVDDPLALRHQWLQSTGKAELVQALGIDTGKLWNQSMPRFAANLGFSPLEPLKPGDVSCLRPMPAVAAEPRHRAADVPAAQFDWTGAGLVNPLDERLVVSANLDNITLASSAACPPTTDDARNAIMSSSSSSSTTSNNVAIRRTSSIPIIRSHPPDTTLNHPNRTQNDRSFGTPPPPPPTPLLTTTPFQPSVTDVSRAVFDQYLDSRVQEILHEAGHSQARPSRPDADWSQQQRPSQLGVTAEGAIEQQPLPHIAAVDGANANAPPTTTHHGNHNPTNQTSTSGPTSTGPSPALQQPQPVSASRVLPCLPGGLKETHIFTPSKARTISGTSAAAAAESEGIVIDETVVTKEYRDVEYNPPIENAAVCLQPTRASIVIDWPEPGSVTGSQMGAFDAVPASVVDRAPVAECGGFATANPVESFDEFLSATMSDDSAAASPQRTLPAPQTTSTARAAQAFDDFSAFQCAPPAPAAVLPAIAQPTTATIAGGLRPALLGSDAILQPQPIGGVGPSASAPMATWSDAGGIDPDEMARLEAIFPTPKTATSRSGASGAAVQSDAGQKSPDTTPKTASQPSGSNKSSPARSVNLSDDVEWSDFVSSDAGCQPITHIINQNILKHQAQQQQQQQQQQHQPNLSADDDDWTDFMSGTVSTTSASARFSPLKSGATPANFADWHAPVVVASLSAAGGWPPMQPQTTSILQPLGATTFLPNVPATSTLNPSPKHQQHQQQRQQKQLNHHQPHQLNGQHHHAQPLDAPFVSAVKAKPSISLIPDLGLVFGRNGNANHLAGSGGGASSAAYRK